MYNNINEDRVFIEIDGRGTWLDCSDLSANDWCVYTTFEGHLETELEKVKTELENENNPEMKKEIIQVICKFEYQIETARDESHDFLILDTDDESGLMGHFKSSEGFDFTKYGELYDWLENTKINLDAVSAYIRNHGVWYIEKSKFENEYIGEFGSNQDFLQNHCEDSFEGINQNWLDWDRVWNDFKGDYFEIDGFYFHNY